MVALKDSSSMTATEYFIWEQTQTERHEFWDGEVIAMSGGTRNHNRISANLFTLIDRELREPSDSGLRSNSHCEIYINDVKVQIESERKYFYPDIVVTCDQREDDSILVQFPCLIIEVLSPSTEGYDRGIKFAQYRRSTTLQEYILVQASGEICEPMVEVFRRNQSGHNQSGQWSLAEYNLNDRLLLESINIEIAIADIYRQIDLTE
jgi:Uma2 family endonuclease